MAVHHVQLASSDERGFGGGLAYGRPRSTRDQPLAGIVNAVVTTKIGNGREVGQEVSNELHSESLRCFRHQRHLLLIPPLDISRHRPFLPR